MKRECNIILKENMLSESNKLVIWPYCQEDLSKHDHEFFELVYITGGSAIHTLNDIGSILTGMLREYQDKQVGYTEIFRLRLLEILILTMRNIVDNHACSTSNRGIIKAIQYINCNFQNQTVLTKFCEQYHFSPQYISRRFKQETGFTVMEYLHKVRIEKSCELLAGSDMRISEIAQTVGYSDLKFFNRLFKRMLNMSPREYRKRLQI